MISVMICPPDCWEGDRCTFCGSISPELFFRLAAEGAEIIPTDKPGKWYIRTETKMAKFYGHHL